LHVPAPLHVPTLVVRPAEHEVVPHAIAAPGYLHALASTPLQVDAQGPAPAHTVRDAMAGLTWTAPVTVTQVPWAPPTSQAWH